MLCLVVVRTVAALRRSVLNEAGSSCTVCAASLLSTWCVLGCSGPFCRNIRLCGESVLVCCVPEKEVLGWGHDDAVC